MLQLALILALTFSVPPTWASENADEVTVERNQKLSDDAIINLSGIEQDPTLSSLEVTRRLQTSGLFSRIQVNRTSDAMTISVDEKTTWFVLPYFSLDASSKI